jgi:methylmalonyl-CoA mutase cobalamin-binding subunit
MLSEPGSLSIGTVEQETGLTKEVLRKWELRYGFPKPARAENGDRLFTPEEVQRLRAIKRLLDSGMRPRHVVPLDAEAIYVLANQECLPSSRDELDVFVDTVFDALRAGTPERLRDLLGQQLGLQGLKGFAHTTFARLNEAIGEAWVSGRLALYEEHLYTETVRNLMTEAIGRLSARLGMPRVLLTTPPGELHGLGLLSVHAQFALAGAPCLSLGTQTPAADLAAAARQYEADVVALSFSAVYPKRRITPYLVEVRRSLPESVHLWAGGAGIGKSLPSIPGVATYASIEPALVALVQLARS